MSTGGRHAAPEGRIVGVSGPTVTAAGMAGVRLYDLVRIGAGRLAGEVIRLAGDEATLQVYEDTTGLELGEAVVSTGASLSVELGPGLLGSVFDGVQRPLDLLRARCGPYLARGIEAPPLDRKTRWEFTPAVAPGQTVAAGGLLGTIAETDVIEHRILVPPGREGTVTEVHRGPLAVDEPAVLLEGGGVLTLSQRWPVRLPRPVCARLDPVTPFTTGQRIMDSFFPLAEGGTAVVPGGFGTGKTVVQHTLARYAAADIIVYVGCGERGNEMTEVLTEFPRLEDPWHHQPLARRTVLIANTSNMPVAAREASLFTGVTIAEYYRDQGYRVALMADSISRWAEALREISSRLEELPGEEGYPTYLGTRVAAFYERSGRARLLGGGEREGSVTLICAVSPPGGDFSEPVTQASLRVAGTLWALDASLAHRRHFPAVNPRISYSLYRDRLAPHFAGSVDKLWSEQVRQAMSLLQKEEELQEVVQLVGVEAIPDRERVTLETGKMLREGFLVQSAFHPTDAFCSPARQFGMLEVVLHLHRRTVEALEAGIPLDRLDGLNVREETVRMKETGDEDFARLRRGLLERIDREIAALRETAGQPFTGEEAP